ncbi:hypothetical protein R6Q59_020763 [Mikania micrantha]
MRATNRVTDSQPKKDVLKFWKQVKDELVLPLLTDLCEKVRLVPPVCFTRLPVELKLKILESVSGVDMARGRLLSLTVNLLANRNYPTYTPPGDISVAYTFTAALSIGSFRFVFFTELYSSH